MLMFSPIFTSSKQHVIAITGKLLNSKKCFGTNNNTRALQQPYNKEQEILQACTSEHLNIILQTTNRVSK